MSSRARFLIITSRFNEDITSALTKGAKDALFEAGVPEEHVSELSVPGAFELPAVAAKAAASGKWQAILCLGCLIQGETDHYHYISEAVANGLANVGVQYKMPVLFGVLNAHSREQALARAQLGKEVMSTRADGKIHVSNKGRSTAEAALLTLKAMGELDGLAL